MIGVMARVRIGRNVRRSGKRLLTRDLLESRLRNPVGVSLISVLAPHNLATRYRPSCEGHVKTERAIAEAYEQ